MLQSYYHRCVIVVVAVVAFLLVARANRNQEPLLLINDRLSIFESKFGLPHGDLIAVDEEQVEAAHRSSFRAQQTTTTMKSSGWLYGYVYSDSSCTGTPDMAVGYITDTCLQGSSTYYPTATSFQITCTKDLGTIATYSGSKCSSSTPSISSFALDCLPLDDSGSSYLKLNCQSKNGIVRLNPQYQFALEESSSTGDCLQSARFYGSTNLHCQNYPDPSGNTSIYLNFSTYTTFNGLDCPLGQEVGRYDAPDNQSLCAANTAIYVGDRNNSLDTPELPFVITRLTNWVVGGVYEAPRRVVIDMRLTLQGINSSIWTANAALYEEVFRSTVLEFVYGVQPELVSVLAVTDIADSSPSALEISYRLFIPNTDDNTTYINGDVARTAITQALTYAGYSGDFTRKLQAKATAMNAVGLQSAEADVSTTDAVSINSTGCVHYCPLPLKAKIGISIAMVLGGFLALGLVAYLYVNRNPSHGFEPLKVVP